MPGERRPVTVLHAATRRRGKEHVMTTTTTTPVTTAIVDETRTEEFTAELLSHYTSGMLALMVDLGHRTGLFDAAAEGPATSEELAARAGLHERYVREWLASLTTGGIVGYDPASATYTLPPEHAAVLTGPGSDNLAPLAQLNTHLAKHVHQVADPFRLGGGVPYSEYRPEFTDVMDAANRGLFDELLVDQWLPLVPDVVERLQRGVRASDIGCGTGHAIVVLAAAFPASTFLGIDIADDAIARAEAEAREVGAGNARFQVADAATFTVADPLDVAFSFDAIHDQVDPRAVVDRIHGALAPGGIYVMVEPAASGLLEENLENPMAPWIYGVSTLHCLTVSLAHGGAGFGTAWGHQGARQLLSDVGFVDIRMFDAPGDPVDAIFVATKR
jgi:SAM-dependent methyltransferase